MLKSLLQPILKPVLSGVFGEVDIPLGMALWLDPSEASNRTMDSTITTNLRSVRDKSVNNLLAENATSGTTQPTLTTLNGKTAINFVGSNSQFLNLGQPSALNLDLTTTTHTIFIVANLAIATGSILSKANATTSLRTNLFSNSTTALASIYGGTQTINATTDRNTTVILRWTLTPTNHTVHLNGQLILTGTSGTGVNTADILLGARRNSGNTGIGFPMTGVVGEIIWYKRQMIANEISQIENSYLPKKWIG